MIVLFGLYSNLCVWGCEKFICAYMAVMHAVCWAIFYTFSMGAVHVPLNYNIVYLQIQQIWVYICSSGVWCLVIWELVPDVLRLGHGSGLTPSSTNYPVPHPSRTISSIWQLWKLLKHTVQILSLFVWNSHWSATAWWYCWSPGNQAVKAADRVININRYPTISVCWILGGDVHILYI